MQDQTRQLGLPHLKLAPGRFRDRVEVSLGGQYNVTGGSMKDALDKMDLFLSGYTACYTKEPRTDRDGSVFEDHCNTILASGGNGGPNDHVVLVQALLALRKELQDGNL